MAEPTAARLAQYDQWHASISHTLDQLLAKLRADIAHAEPVSRAEEAALLAALLRDQPVGHAFLTDLIAVALVRIVRTDATPATDATETGADHA